MGKTFIGRGTLYVPEPDEAERERRAILIECVRMSVRHHGDLSGMTDGDRADATSEFPDVVAAIAAFTMARRLLDFELEDLS